MVAKKPNSDKWVRRDSHSGKYIDKKSERQTPATVPDKKDTGGTDSTGPRKEKRKTDSTGPA